MKRPSLKFDKDAILGFLFAHCEKFVMAAVGLGMLAFLWGGINAVRLDSVKPEQTPESLANLTSTVNKHIAAAARPPATKTRVGGKLAPAIDPWRPQQVKIAPPPEMAVLDRPLFQEKSKRTKPDVFPIEDLRATAGIAVFPVPAADPQAGQPAARPPIGALPPEPPRPGQGKGRGRRGEEPPAIAPPLPGLDAATGDATPGRIVPYVVVTGLVPVAKQQAEFDRCFSSASLRDPQTDAPRWSQYLVERTVDGSGPEKWERLKVKNVDTFDQRADAVGRPAESLQQEMLPATFLLGPTEAEIGYAAAVPQRIDDAWGFATVHPWFRPQLERLLEENRLGHVDRPAETIEAERLEKAPDEFVGEQLLLEGMKFVGEPDSQRNVGLVAYAVRSAAGEPSFDTAEIGSVSRTVFAVSAPWARILAVDGGVTPDAACSLRVRIEQVGETPVARILGIRYLDADGVAGDELADPNPLPLAANAPGGFAPGGMPQAGGPVAGAEFRLFRFVDTDVKPGLRYRYRVKFALRNPNFGLDQQFLADAAAAKGEFLVSKESNATSAVTVPEPTAILARPLSKDDAKRMKLKIGSYEVLVLGASRDTGNFVVRSILTEVGGLANVDPSLNKPGDQRTRGEPISTGRILVDVRGRQDDRAGSTRGSGPAADPFEMLFFDPDSGTFEFVSAADSQRRFDQYGHTLPAADEPKKGGAKQPGGLPSGLNPYEVPPSGRGAP